ncbi:MAG: magnesium/cobalt transporter CorA, partial [Pseudomonadota bacterium]|nr:magnesium/cobalt transporter CorA [Pseudomonadota bacterium]
GEGFLLTFQERAGDCFDPVRERIRRRHSQLRERGADYLTYALLDAVVDSGFPVLEACGERLEVLEAAVSSGSRDVQVTDIHRIKRELLDLRRTVWPQREMVSALAREPTAYISDQTRIYLRDCYDHTVQLMDLLETYREIASSLIDLYLSSVNARMNEIMKVLTIIATLFMPLSFVASLYGMNFDRTVSPWNMPELGWALGYPFILVLMLAMAFGMLWFFLRRGWIGNRAARRGGAPRGRRRQA